MTQPTIDPVSVLRAADEVDWAELDTVDGRAAAAPAHLLALLDGDIGARGKAIQFLNEAMLGWELRCGGTVDVFMYSATASFVKIVARPLLPPTRSCEPTSWA